MRIAVDAMGGDYSPLEIVKGAILAVERFNVTVALVGQPDQINSVTKETGLPSTGIDIVPAAQVVEMTDHPVSALKQKPGSSLGVAVDLVKKGEAQALVSAGNTGATMAFSLFGLGRLPGVERPAIAVPLPTSRGFCVFIDAGANMEVKPGYLLQFAQMGSLYAETILGWSNPTVALLNIGSEPEKGTQCLQQAFQLLSSSGLNFIGNIEGRDLPHGKADIVVTDGFSGNLVLKLTEGLSTAIMDMLKTEIGTCGFGVKLGAYLTRPAFRKLKARMNFEEYGGALLLGLRHPVVISHGSSKAWAIANAIRVAKVAVQQKVPDRIAASMK